MVRAKNVLSVSMQVFVTFSVLSVLWAIYGYSIAFTGGNAFFGGFDRTFLSGMLDAAGNLAPAATFSKGVYIPEYLYAAFQMTFAGITPCLIVGAFAERMKFSAVLLFMVLWFTFSYLPIAHMVWFWAGPDAYTDAAAAKLPTASAGFLFQKGALDFAGGTVVHINAGIAGLVGCLLVGKRKGYGTTAMAPHNVPLHHDRRGVAVGRLVRLQRRLEPRSERVRRAGLHQHVPRHRRRGRAAGRSRSGSSAARPRCSVQRRARSPAWSPSRRPAAGSARWARWSSACWPAWSACSRSRSSSRALGYDDSLDVFGVHCVGGILGAILTGVFNNPALGGTGVYDYVAGTWGFAGTFAQVTSQLWGVGVTLAVVRRRVSFIGYKIVDLVIGLRATEEHETEGLDTVEHGERGYSL